MAKKYEVVNHLAQSCNKTFKVMVHINVCFSKLNIITCIGQRLTKIDQQTNLLLEAIDKSVAY